MTCMTTAQAREKLNQIDASATDSESWLEAYPDDGVLYFYGEIGPSRWNAIDSATFATELRKMNGQHFVMHLNSPGGSVDEGIAIFNAIAHYKPGITIVVDSLAASMASYILCAGTKRIVHSNSAIMVHAPWSMTAGNADDLRKDAELLDKYGARMVENYASATGHSAKEIKRLMEAETWFFGQEAVDAGFADSVLVPSSRLTVAAKAHDWNARTNAIAARSRIAKSKAVAVLAGHCV